MDSCPSGCLIMNPEKTSRETCPEGCWCVVLPGFQAATQQICFSSTPSTFCSPAAGGSACASGGAGCPSPSWLLSPPWPQLSAGTRRARGGASRCSPPSARCGTGCSTSPAPWLPPCKTRLGQWAGEEGSCRAGHTGCLHSQLIMGAQHRLQTDTHTLLSLENNVI